jgi:hypothetical protein
MAKGNSERTMTRGIMQYATARQKESKNKRMGDRIPQQLTGWKIAAKPR